MPTDNSAPKPVRHIVILVHGIRTFGDWQDRFRKIIKEADPAIEVHTFKYKYLSVIAFLIPLLRNIVVRKFVSFLSDHQANWRDARVDIFAHSFGTYLVGGAIKSISPKAMRFNTIVLSGCVLKVTFPWNDFIARGSVRWVINDCGSKDVWPLIAQLLVLGMGISGRYGFVGDIGPDSGLINRYFLLGHSGFFLQSQKFPGNDAFMTENWLPFLTLDRLPDWDVQIPMRAKWFAGFEMFAEPIKIMALLLTVVVAYVGAVKYKTTRDLAEFDNYLRLANESKDSNPINALVAVIQAEGVGVSIDSPRASQLATLKSHALSVASESLRAQAQRRRNFIGNWREGGFLSGRGYFTGEKQALGDVSSDDRWQVVMLSGTQSLGPKAKNLIVRVDRFPPWEAVLLDPPSCPGQSPLNLTALRFMRKRNWILVGMEQFIFVYDEIGKLKANICEYVTKDQWNYIELMEGTEDILLASANEGQIMFFKVDQGVLKRLTGEFDHQKRDGGAIISMEQLDGLALTTHHLGRAYLWRFVLDKQPRLEEIYEFKPTRAKGQSSSMNFSPKAPDDEFVTAAAMTKYDNHLFFLTTYKTGAAIEWKLTDGTVQEMRRLTDTTNISLAVFSNDGSRIVTLSEKALKLWETNSSNAPVSIELN